MSNNAEVVFTGNANDLLDKYRQINGANDQLVAGLGKVATGHKQAANEAKALGRDAAKAFNDTRTAAEKNNIQLARLSDLLKKGHIDQETYNRAVAKSNTLLLQSEQAGKAAAGGFKNAAASVGEFATAITGVGGVMAGVMALIQSAKQEAADIGRQRQAAATAQMEAGEALRRGKSAFVADQTMSGDQFESEAEGIAARTGASVSTVAGALQSSLSAKGSMTNKEAFAHVETALAIDPNDAATAAEVGSRAIDLGHITGQHDPRANVGFLQSIQQSARVTSLQAAGQNLVPAVNALTTLGDSPEQAAEMTAALTQLSKDSTGAISGTGAIQLSQQMVEFAKASKDKRFEGAHGPSAVLGVLQQNQDLRDKFSENLHVETKMRAPIDNLLSADPKAMAEYRQAQRTIVAPGQAQIDKFDAYMQDLNSGKYEGARQAKVGSEANTQDYLRGQGKEGRIASAKNVLEQTYSQFDFTGGAGIDWLVESAANTAFHKSTEGGQTPELAAAGVLRSMQKNEGERYFKGGPTEEQQQYLKKQIELLERLNKNLENNTKSTEQNTTENRRPRPRGGMPERGLSRSS